MKIYRYLLLGLTAGLSAFAVSSCAYDGYSSSGYGGYGNGYGYGNSGFSTSYFISTGNSRWGYDPYAGSYYDYTRRAYYDPYLNGYYPVGYRPRYVSGSPHPYGWRRGGRSISPPRNVRSYNLKNFSSRTDRYRNLGKDWSKNVRGDSGRGQSSQFNRTRDQRNSQPSNFQRSGPSGRDQRSRSSSGFQRSNDSSNRFRGNTSVSTQQPRVQGNRSSSSRDRGSSSNRSSSSNRGSSSNRSSSSNRGSSSGRSSSSNRGSSSGRSISSSGGSGNRTLNTGGSQPDPGPTPCQSLIAIQ